MLFPVTGCTSYRRGLPRRLLRDDDLLEKLDPFAFGIEYSGSALT